MGQSLAGVSYGQVTSGRASVILELGDRPTVTPNNSSGS